MALAPVLTCSDPVLAPLPAFSRPSTLMVIWGETGQTVVNSFVDALNFYAVSAAIVVACRPVVVIEMVKQLIVIHRRSTSAEQALSG